MRRNILLLSSNKTTVTFDDGDWVVVKRNNDTKQENSITHWKCTTYKWIELAKNEKKIKKRNVVHTQTSIDKRVAKAQMENHWRKIHLRINKAKKKENHQIAHTLM